MHARGAGDILIDVARDASGERVWKGRTVILTDDATAGPAEVFAAALRDRAGATTVGETTVGMAIVQRLVPTETGGSLYITVGGRGTHGTVYRVTYTGEKENPAQPFAVSPPHRATPRLSPTPSGKSGG